VKQTGAMNCKQLSMIACPRIPFACLIVTPTIAATTSPSLAPPGSLTTLLFEALRLLAIVPAFIGAPTNIWCVSNPPGLYLKFISDSGSRICQETDSWSRVICRVGLILSSPYFG
jgi:hypothetical protein